MVPAVILAGGSRREDKLLQAVGAEAKSLIKINNKEMVRYVVEALVGSGRVSRLVVVGLHPQVLPDLAPAHIPVEFVADEGSLIANALAGLAQVAKERRALFVTCDIPLLTGDVVRYFLDECARWDAGFNYPIVPREVMEARFPGCGRSYRHLRDGDFAGGDIGLVDPKVILGKESLLAQLAVARKSGWQIVRHFGLKIIFDYLTRRLTIAEGEKKGEEVFGCRCKAIISQYAEIGMDVDKPNQLRMVRAELERAAV